jgi:hypothetical protein
MGLAAQAPTAGAEHPRENAEHGEVVQEGSIRRSPCGAQGAVTLDIREGRLRIECFCALQLRGGLFG